MEDREKDREKERALLQEKLGIVQSQNSVLEQQVAALNAHLAKAVRFPSHISPHLHSRDHFLHTSHEELPAFELASAAMRGGERKRERVCV